MRNESLRKFRIVADDPFSSPTIGGEGDDSFEITPLFDHAAEGLVVPWSSTTFHGLMILEVSSGQVLRFSVGPKGADAEHDWLRWHDKDWRPVDEEHWLELGRRHWLGAIGTSVQLRLAFREPFSLSSPGLSPEELSSPEALAQCVVFQSEADCAHPATVFLNVYDLAPVTSAVNSLLCNTMVKTFGAFHATIEVFGNEWGFYRQQEPLVCGVLRSRQPRHHPVHVYRQSVNLGQTAITEEATIRLIKTELAKAWPGGRYDLIHCNCIHFCEELARRLGVQPVPSWVRSLHETGAAAASVFRSFTGSPAVADQERVEVLLTGLKELPPQQLPRDMTIGSLRKILPELGISDTRVQVLAAGGPLQDNESLGRLFDDNEKPLRLSLRQTCEEREAEAPQGS